MMKKILVILFLISGLIAQEKYLIYFKDKAISENEFNSQKELLLKSGVIHLSEKAIERRRKTLGNNYLTYKDLPVNNNYISAIESGGIKIINKLKWFNAVSAYLTTEQRERISSLEFVKKIDKARTIKFKRDFQKESTEKKYKTSSGDNLDYGQSLLQNEMHDITDVHNAGINGEGIIIGFLDSGFNWETHPALENLNVLYEYDYVNYDEETADEVGDPFGQDGHGTSVFSIGAGYAEGELIGPAYGASFFLAKTEDISSETRVEEVNFAAAVEDFEAMGVDIITASLGYSEFDLEKESYTYEDMNGNTTLVAQAYNYAFDLGVVTVAAAGNEGNNDDWGHHIVSPADAFNVITVGNINSEGILHSSSGRGPTSDGRIKPEVTAMGTYNYHAVSGGWYSDGGYGTSFAAPMVAGMIGQLLSAYPYLNNRQVRSIVLHSGDNFENPNNDIGYGKLSIKSAVNFPNISKDQNNSYSINKMFVDVGISSSNDFKIYYKINDDEWINNDFVYAGDSVVYSCEVPATSADDVVTFYYTFRDSANTLVREPLDKNYSASISESIVDYVTGVVEFPDELVKDYKLHQNYPNPFNPSTVIEFESPSNEFAKVIIYNVLGQKIRELFAGIVVKGLTRFKWDGTNDNGELVPSGTYIYSINIAGKNLSKKMMLLK